MKKLFAFVAAVVFAFALAGCSSGTLGVDSDDTGVHAKAEGAAEGEGTGHITIGEGKGLCINHMVEKGTFHVKATDEKGNVVFDEDLTDNIADFVDVQGEFDIVVGAKGATGTVDIIAYDKEAQAAADSTLDDAVKSATGKSAAEMGLKQDDSEKK